MRAALYARYSTDDQSATSCEDQLALCRAYAAQIGAQVVREFADDGISGFATGNRPGVRALLDAARRGEVDMVIAEHTDRLSRGLSGSGAIYEDLKSFGVRYQTVNQGAVTVALAGLSGLVSAMTLEEGANKTRRGLRARVEAGRSGGGITYGYRKVLAYDAAGEPLRGLVEIDPDQAAVVRHILADYAAGASPQAIAHALNQGGVAGPRGRTWNASTIAGSAARGCGIIHNALYAGVRVWGRQTFVKDRNTGKRRGIKAPGEPLRAPAPDLQIAPDDLWQAVRARHAAMTTGPHGAAPSGRRRPTRLLSGLIVCALCERPMRRSGPNQALRCATRVEKGLCANTRAPTYPALEARVMQAIGAHLLAPEAIELAISEIQTASQTSRRERDRRAAKAAAELAEVKRRAGRLVDQIADGQLPGAAVRDRLDELDARRAALEAELNPSAGDAAADADVLGAIPIGPAAAGMYRRMVEALASAIDTPTDLVSREAREAVRALISQVRFTPLPAHGAYGLEIVGDLGPILQLATRKGPLAGALTETKRIVGAGTRSSRSLSIPFRQVA